MKASDLFYLSFQNFKNQGSRTVLTILGVSVGIGAILFLVSFGYGLQYILLERITTLESLLTLDISSPETKIITLNEANINRISQLENVEKVSPQAVFLSQISLGELTSETTINLVDADFFLLSGTFPRIGRDFLEKDSQKIVVNSLVAELFNVLPEDFLGKILKVTVFIQKEEEGGVAEVEIFRSEKEFEVVGVIEEAPGNPSQIFLRRADLPELPIKEYQLAKVKVVQDNFVEEVREELIGMGFMVSSLSDTVAQANKIFGAIQLTLGVFGIVALIVAAIGLINTMTISLLERTSDIGIMRAIGASPGDIKMLFLVESLIIGFLGGLCGIIIGIIGAELFNFGINILASNLGGQTIKLFVYPVWFIVFIIILSTIVGFIAGFWPAKRASKLNTLDALRYK